MPYTGNPSTDPVDEIRLMVGDIYPDFEVLQDADYQYFLDKYNGNVNRASIDAARSIMFLLSRWTRERTGDIEVYGSEWARNYRAALLEFVKNPALSISLAMPYAGGISKADMRANDSNSDNVRPSVYAGQSDGEHVYDVNQSSDFF